MNEFSFEVHVDVDDATGEVLAGYFRIRKGRVHETIEFAGGNVFADYNKNGELLGIELLGPCKTSIVDQIAPEESTQLRSRTKRFMKNSGPRQLVA